ncbi:hypothetical protein HCI99_13115 [Listeria booriae]|uniref:Thiopeptide-type bacteriocin biosynthesis domain-containing protein n=1 Tax=Listeria booriae TaxID=1552123 RepID=A0A7X0XEK7_9LIST|nr:hypothetical protein [Listeria booriae]MBC1492758.1 hypothetical protein [Listeria booriae]
MTIRIYDYSKSKVPLMNYLNDEILNHIHVKYYLDTDWFRGPNILIQLANESKEKELCHQITKKVERFKRYNPIPTELIHKKMQFYMREQQRLIDLELRKHEGILNMENDGKIVIMGRKTGIYNSSYHKTILDQNKYFLQEIHNKILKIIPDMCEEELISFFVEQFKYIALLYNGKYEEGYISFLSHVVGFFSRAKKEGGNILYKEKFETMYTRHYKGASILSNQTLSILDEWKNIWAQISDNLRINLKEMVEEDTRYINLDEQYNTFVENISKIESPFHDRLLEKTNVKEFMMSEQMLHYRNIINLFYSTLPLFEQSMLYKHFYGFCVIKDVQNKCDNLLMEI